MLGTEVLFRFPFGAWISNDEANHRIALTAFPNFVEDPEKDTRTGLHHTAFEYAGFEELNASYLRLKEAGIVPAFCLDHGMTFSYYYRRPGRQPRRAAGRQLRRLGEVERVRAREPGVRTRTRSASSSTPIAWPRPTPTGATFEEIHARAMAGEFAPDTPPLEVPQVEA